MRGCETNASSKEAPVALVLSFLELLQPLSCVMTCPAFDSVLTVLTGWVFARRRNVTGVILAAGAVGPGHKHHSACHRVFAAARWSLDDLGLAAFGLLLPPHRPWYRTTAAPPFADMLATLRCRSAAGSTTTTRPHDRPGRKMKDTLIGVLKPAA
jgi:hypothetical protein